MGNFLCVCVCVYWVLFVGWFLSIHHSEEESTSKLWNVLRAWELRLKRKMPMFLVCITCRQIEYIYSCKTNPEKSKVSSQSISIKRHADRKIHTNNSICGSEPSGSWAEDSNSGRSWATLWIPSWQWWQTWLTVCSDHETCSLSFCWRSTIHCPIHQHIPQEYTVINT
jgi:hypothetical protein